MAFFDTTWYANSVGYTAVTAWATGASIAAGALRRQLAAPAVGSERVFVCIVAGTTHATTEPTWVVTRGAKTTDNTITWQECTGAAAANGDATNTPASSSVRSLAVTLGQIIKNNSATHYFIASTAGTPGASEPTYNTTAGATTTDGTCTWTSLGAVGNFTGGQAPHARLANACASTWFASGNTIYVGDNHAESQATTITIAPANTVGTAIGRILCHNHSGSYPPASADLTTGATVTATGAVNFTISCSVGAVYIYGLTFQAGSGSNNAFLIIGPSNNGIFLDSCSLQLTNTNAGAIIQFGGSGGYSNLSLVNTTVKFGNTSQSISLLPGVHIWKGGSLASGSSVPSSLFNMNVTNASPQLVIEAVDLSAITGSLFAFSQAMAGSFLLKDCKLNASVTVTTPTTTGLVIQTVRSDSGATAYKSTRYSYEGTETTETSITRVGGASDPTSQAQSRKVVTSANAQWLRPFKAEPYAIWNPTTGSNVTVTVYGTVNSGTLPNNDDLFMEVEYLGSSATPIGTITTTTKSNVLASNAAVSSDGSTWNGGGSGAGWSPFKLTTTLSSPQPGMAGNIHARVRAGKASATYYIDPKVVLT